MDKNKLQNVRTQIRTQLDACINFWLKNGIDKVNGGVYTCLDREGKVYSTDKSVWMQGRCAWTFSWLCRTYGKKQEWLDAAKSCLDFMEKYCINRELGDRMYFTVTGDGKPLRQRRYYFSETFYCMANAEYYGLTGEKVYLDFDVAVDEGVSLTPFVVKNGDRFSVTGNFTFKADAEPGTYSVEVDAYGCEYIFQNVFTIK